MHLMAARALVTAIGHWSGASSKEAINLLSAFWRAIKIFLVRIDEFNFCATGLLLGLGDLRFKYRLGNGVRLGSAKRFIHLHPRLHRVRLVSLIQRGDIGVGQVARLILQWLFLLPQIRLCLRLFL